MWGSCHSDPQANDYGLVLDVIDAEYQFDRKKLTFFYDATDRCGLLFYPSVAQPQAATPQPGTLCFPVLDS